MPFDRSQGVRDPKFLRAMAHPLRMKLDQLLSVHGPMTATQLSELVDESPANCSYHLRTMAKWGFIEEAEGGKGRERRWKSVAGGWGVDPEDLSAEGKAAHRALRAVQRQHRDWQDEQWQERKEDFPEEWRHRVFTSDWEGPLSVEQLAEISDGFAEVLARVQSQERPDDAVLVHIHINAIPIGEPPPRKSPRGRKKKS
ncbi:MAG TPA: helix-turn-helix domain-containing protein [Mycobacteriales bacterium]|nr:helix-turn-helix domain-containing protein [Mycobacteriales bacterium]